MPIRVPCPHCQMVHNVPENVCGKQIQCKNCNHVFAAPAQPPRLEAIPEPPTSPPATKAETGIKPDAPAPLGSPGQRREPPAASDFSAGNPARLPIHATHSPIESARSIMPASERFGFNIADVPEQLLYPPAPDLKEVLKDPATEAIYQNTPKILLRLVVDVIAAVVLSIAGISIFFVHICVGSFLLLLSGLCWLIAPVLTISLFDRSAKLVFMEQGFFSRVGDKDEFIPWLRIKEMELYEAHLLVVLVGKNGKESHHKIPLDALRGDPQTITDKMEQYMEDAREEFMKGSR